jgi:hypothetical protein
MDIVLSSYDGEFQFADIEYDAEKILKKFKIEYPLALTAIKSNWMGQTLCAVAENSNVLIERLFSFGNDSGEFRYDKEEKELYFYTASHDVPCGFAIYIRHHDEDEEE